MWDVGVGAMEIAMIVAVGAVVSCLGRRARGWGIGIVSILAVSAVATPADPLSMLIVAVPLSAAFVAGVYSAPRIRASGDANA
jgi:Sec-independent protein secretion pathway component TatC